MDVAAWFRPPRQVLTTFLAAAALSAVVLAGLAWQLLSQDREVEVRRQQIQLDRTADALVETMRQGLAALEAGLGTPDAWNRSLPDGVVAVSMTSNSVRSSPAGSLPYVPFSPVIGPPPGTFDEGERLEFAVGDPVSALTAYARLTVARDPTVRAGALMRQARVHRERGAFEPALAAYSALEALDSVNVEGLPAGLVASVGRLDVYDARRETKLRDDEARRVLNALDAGRWEVARTVYETYTSLARRVLAEAPPGDRLANARADATAWLWNQRSTDTPVTRRTLTLSSGVVVVVWTSTAATLDALLVSPSFIESLAAAVPESHSGWGASDADGQRLFGDVPSGGLKTARTPRESGLPWTLHVFPADGQPAPISPRRTQLWLVLGLLAAVLYAGWYLTFRALSRERRVAALQSDFVAAVSHEFRSPLTALSHAADVLVNDRLTSDALRRQTYEVLDRDTARLRTLVEDLLESGRLESGGAIFRFEHVDISALVRETVGEFQAGVARRGYRIGLATIADDVTATVDREAVARALRNLLDNAVKYSPDVQQVDVHITYAAGHVAIAVQDHGIGIPAGEQQTIFDRFVRGAESKARRIHGTGIGLAMVRQIARAHGGDVEVSSAPGQGSTFTIRIPATRHPSAAAHPSAVLG